MNIDFTPSFFRLFIRHFFFFCLAKGIGKRENKDFVKLSTKNGNVDIVNEASGREGRIWKRKLKKLFLRKWK